MGTNKAIQGILIVNALVMGGVTVIVGVGSVLWSGLCGHSKDSSSLLSSTSIHPLTHPQNPRILFGNSTL